MRSDWLLLIVPGLIWGASFLFIAEGLRAIGPGGVAFVRICIGFATLALFPSARKPVERADWKSVWHWFGEESPRRGLPSSLRSPFPPGSANT